MPATATTLWTLAAQLPIVAGFGAGVWLLRSGQRLAGSSFLVWAAGQLALAMAMYWVMYDWQHRPGVTPNDWFPVIRWLYFGMRASIVCGLIAFTVALSRSGRGLS